MEMSVRNELLEKIRDRIVEAILPTESREWVDFSTSTSLDPCEVTTTDNTQTEVCRREIMPGEGFSILLVIDAKRTDQTGWFAGRYRFIAFKNGATTLLTPIKIMFEDSTEVLSIDVDTDANDLVLSVRGRMNQTWHWKTVAFFHDIE